MPYSRQTFIDGQILTAAHLNHIEEGISNAENYPVTSVNGQTGAIIINSPTNTSELTNDSGFITEETDPTVPAWAKNATKPTYTANEVGAVKKTGDTMTGALTMGSSSATTGIPISFKATINNTECHMMEFVSAGGNARIDHYKNNSMVNSMQMSESSTTFMQPISITSGGTGANNATGALTNLGIIYSETEPTVIEGGIWLQPMS